MYYKEKHVRVEFLLSDVDSKIYMLELYEFTHLMPTSLSLKCRPPFKHREVLLNVLSSPSSKT